MPNCTVEAIALGKVGRRVIEATFDGGDIVSDGGVLLLRQVDQRIGLTRAIARVFEDRRRRAIVAHSLRDMLAQRIYGLCCGWEDVCDHNVLRRDLALQTAVGRVDDLASAPTLSRLETSQNGAAIAQQAQLAAPVENCEALLADLEAVADTGAEALEAAWKAISKEQRKALAGELDALKARAAGADKGGDYVPE